MVTRLVRDNPFGDLRIYASSFGRAFDISLNPQSPLRIGRHLRKSTTRRNSGWRDSMLESVGQRSPKNGYDVDDNESFRKPMSWTFQNSLLI